MRHYPVNSPQAAARIVALALVADGHLSHAELETVRNLRIAEQLGLDGPGWHEVLTAFCQDLLLSSRNSWSDVCRMEPALLERMMSEIEDPELQRTVLRLCVSLAESDGPVTDSEAMMLDTAVDQWGLGDEYVGAAHA
jgi:tellurite resistance protein